uniref:Uncharacterized protein n=1 Tax=Moniliophthora roreri TaxID=221103 RepID=A0A0W0G7F6_MONRR
MALTYPFSFQEEQRWPYSDLSDPEEYLNSLDKFEHLQHDLEDYQKLKDGLKFDVATYLARAKWFRNLNEEKIKCAMCFWEEYALEVLDSVVKKLGSWTKENAERFEGENILPYYDEFLDMAAMAYCKWEDLTYLGEDLQHSLLVEWYKENAKKEQHV